MKKLMMMLAIGSISAVASAASVNWGANVSNGQDAEQTARAGTVFNAIYIGTKDYSASLATFVYDTYTGLVGTGTSANFKAAEGQTILDTHTLTATEAANYQFMDTVERADADGGVNGNWLVTMFDATTPDYFYVAQYTVSGATDTTSAGNIFDDSWNFGATMYSGVTNSAPEPTSGLLMLLGMAGLALKRKRA